jgi:hypothetical protein
LYPKNKDNIANLRASINYYEHVAEPGPDPQRKALLETMALKLKKVLTKVEDETAGKDEPSLTCKTNNLLCSLAIDKEISGLKARSRILFDSPDLQRRRVSWMTKKVSVAFPAHLYLSSTI